MAEFYFTEPTGFKKSFWQEILPYSWDKSTFQGCKDSVCAVGIILKKPMEHQIRKLRKFAKWFEKNYKKSKCEIRKHAKTGEVALVCFIGRNDIVGGWMDVRGFVDLLNIDEVFLIIDEEEIEKSDLRDKFFKWRGAVSTGGGGGYLIGCTFEECITAVSLKRPTKSELERLKDLMKKIEKAFKAKCKIKEEKESERVSLVCSTRDDKVLGAEELVKEFFGVKEWETI